MSTNKRRKPLSLTPKECEELEKWQSGKDLQKDLIATALKMLANGSSVDGVCATVGYGRTWVYDLWHLFEVGSIKGIEPRNQKRRWG